MTKLSAEREEEVREAWNKSLARKKKELDFCETLEHWMSRSTFWTPEVFFRDGYAIAKGWGKEEK